MKKFHDVKVRKKRFPSLDEHTIENNEQGNEFSVADFWLGTHEPQKLRVVNYSRLCKIYMNIIAVISVMVILVGRGSTVLADLEKQSQSAQTYLEQSINNIDANNFDLAIDNADKARAIIQDLKINLQSWGQDSKFLHLMNYNSSLEDVEKLLSVVENIISVSVVTGDLAREYGGFFSEKDITSSAELNIDLNVVRLVNKIDDLAEKISDLTEIINRMQLKKIAFADDSMGQIIEKMEESSHSIKTFQKSLLPILKWYAAENTQRDILILFQNNSEIRGSGGFIGSYAVMTTARGSIKKIDFQTNIYKLDNNSTDRIKVSAPEEFKVLADGKIFLRDSNYAIDGGESFSLVKNTYEIESGKNIDGIIAIDTTVITEILGIIGEIEMPEYNMVITKDNFLNNIQNEVEKEYFLRPGAKEENEPKKILSEIMPIFIKKTLTQLSDKKVSNSLLALFPKFFKQKHILLYSEDIDVQNIIISLNYGATVNNNSDYDYIYSHSSNIKGAKSSLNIDEYVEDNITIGSDLSVEHNLHIKRSHNGSWNWPDGDNVNFIRLLLPKAPIIKYFSPIRGDFTPHNDSKFASDYQYKVDSEAGKGKMSFWMNTKPADYSEVKVGYVTKSGIKQENGEIYYSLLIQKQPGTPNYKYKLILSSDSLLKIENSDKNGNLPIEFILDGDKLIKIRLSKK